MKRQKIMTFNNIGTPYFRTRPTTNMTAKKTNAMYAAAELFV